MNVRLPIPAGFRERLGPLSEVITRPGFPHYSVLFTTSDNPSATDFDTSKLVGTLIEDVSRDPAITDRFFRVLGGYRHTPVEGGRGPTTEVFGIALDPAFGIKEGGTTIIFDNWRITGHLHIRLDENLPIFDDPTSQAGWTFIIEPKFGEDVYPESTDPLALWMECPSITSVDTEYAEPSETHQKVSFHINTSYGAIEKVKIDFGDGSPLQEFRSLEDISHLYERKEGGATNHKVQILIEGLESCKDSTTIEVEIPGIECPTIKSFTLAADAPTDKEVKVVATLVIEGEADSIIIDWGDGSPPETFTAAPFEHTYQRPIGGTQNFKVNVKIEGTASCKANASANIDILGICPVIESIKVEDLNHSDYTQEVKAMAIMANGLNAEIYTWDFGDGSPIQQTNIPEAVHVYNKEDKEKEYTLSVDTSGPGSCTGNAKVDIKVGKGLTCPVIQKLSFKLTPAPKGKMKVEAEVQWEQDNPSTIDFDWGDGTIDKDVNSTNASHEYDQPDGVFKVYKVTVTLNGPGKCLSSRTEKVRIPARKCGKIDAVKITVNNTSVSEQSVTATLDLAGTFDNYTYDWGDGTVDGPNSASSATHVYTRGTQDHTHTIKVSGKGPGPCKDDATASHTVPAKEKVIPPPPPPTPELPAICTYWHYVVAFLSALTLGHLAILITALSTTGTDTNIAWGTSIASVILLIIAIIVWYRFCKPSRCDWLAVGWVTFLGAAMPIFSSIDCAEQEPLIPTLLSFVIGGVFGFFWFRSCSPKSKSRVFLIYFGLLVLAALIAGLLTAKAVMNC